MRLLPLTQTCCLVSLLSALALAGAADAASAAPSVSKMTLINADTDKPITGYTTLTSGMTLDLAKLPTTHLNIAAITSPSTVGSVAFYLDGKKVRTQNSEIGRA